MTIRILFFILPSYVSKSLRQNRLPNGLRSLLVNFVVILAASFTLIGLILGLLIMASQKKIISKEEMSSFERGFNMFFFSRYSFSIQYFKIAAIFLLLDLELCLILPFLNINRQDYIEILVLIMLASVLLIGLYQEWVDNALDWVE